MTLLDGFRALDDARVRLTLDGPAHLETEAGMLRSGIYRLELTPTLAGTYRGRLEIIEGGEGSVDGLELVVYPDAEQAAEAVPPEGHAISFLKEQQWRVPFATAFATRGAVRPTVEVPGEIDTPPDGSSHVHAPVAGRVLPGRGGFPVPGREVEHGQELATIALTPASPEQSTRAELDVVEAQARREAAQAELSRMQRLVADQAIPARRVAEAERHLRVSEAAVSAAERARSMYTAASGGRGRGSWRITAPIDGVIDRVDVSPGEAVNANEPLFRIIDASDRWVVAKVPETWAARIHPERDVSFHLLGEETWRPLTGTLVDVSRAVDPTSRTVTVIWSRHRRRARAAGGRSSAGGHPRRRAERRRGRAALGAGRRGRPRRRLRADLGRALRRAERAHRRLGRSRGGPPRGRARRRARRDHRRLPRPPRFARRHRGRPRARALMSSVRSRLARLPTEQRGAA